MKLKEIWDAMYQDYSDAISGDAEMAMLNHVRKTALLEFKVTKSLAILEYLSYRPDEDLEKLLIQMGSADSRMPDSPTLKESWVKRINGRIKRWQAEVDQENKQLELLNQSRQLAGGSTTRESFQDLIVQLEKYLQFSINQRETMVTKFIAIIKDYQRYIIAQSKNKK